MARILSAIIDKFKSPRAKKKPEEMEENGEKKEVVGTDGVKESKEEQRYQRTLFVVIVLSIVAALIIASFVMYYPREEEVVIDIQRPQVIVFYSFACSGCVDYIDNVLIMKFEDAGFENITKKDYINDLDNRKEMSELDKMLDVPSELQGHISTYLFTNSTNNATVILKGHIPEHILSSLLFTENATVFDKLIVTQDEMENPTSYKVWAFKGDVKEYPVDTPIGVYLQWFEENKDNLDVSEEGSLLPLILVTGFLDGINPCAIAILLFFIAFLFTMRKTR
ncbi:MAG: hypothetical protein KAI64_03045, partial [Thermoplasmata archaeon]|nr:hypothetical protein [Thermoplasmata archaeon]